MVATVATVAYLGLEARAVEVQVQLISGCRASSSSACPTRPCRKPRAGSRRADRHRARASAQGITVNLSPADLPKEGSHFDLPIACACSPRSARPTPKACRIMSRSGSSAWMAASPPRPACCSPRCMPAADMGLICPAVAGQRGGLGGRSRRDRRARLAGAAGPSQGHRAGRGPRRSRPNRPRAAPTLARSRARRSPSARSRSPRQAATIC